MDLTEFTENVQRLTAIFAKNAGGQDRFLQFQAAVATLYIYELSGI